MNAYTCIIRTIVLIYHDFKGLIVLLYYQN